MLKGRKTLEIDTDVFEEFRVQEENSFYFCHNMILCMSVSARLSYPHIVIYLLFPTWFSLDFCILAFLLLVYYSASLLPLVTIKFFQHNDNKV